jgi:hypothetical protein
VGVKREDAKRKDLKREDIDDKDMEQADFKHEPDLEFVHLALRGGPRLENRGQGLPRVSDIKEESDDDNLGPVTRTYRRRSRGVEGGSLRVGTRLRRRAPSPIPRVDEEDELEERRRKKRASGNTRTPWSSLSDSTAGPMTRSRRRKAEQKALKLRSSGVKTKVSGRWFPTCALSADR